MPHFLYLTPDYLDAWAADMLTTFLIIPPVGKIQKMQTQLAPQPGHDSLCHLINPHLDGELLEHVAVLYEGKRCDMFVGECSSINGRAIRNVRATEIYRSNTLSQSPWLDPDDLPSISGPAVLFPDRRVWR